MSEITKNELGKLIQRFNDKQELLSAVIAILAENKKAVDKVAEDTIASIAPVLEQLAQLDTATQESVKSTLESLKTEYEGYLKSLQENTTLNRAELEKSLKAQNERSFKRVQALISNIKLPKDGKDGKNADPTEVVNLVLAQIKFPEQILETAESVRDKLETLEGDERLDWKAIKGLPDYFKMAKKAGRQMLVGGIRFFENLADVSIIHTNKRQDLIAQYDTTNNRWQDGHALSVGTTEPTNPKELDIWIDVS